VRVISKARSTTPTQSSKGWRRTTKERSRDNGFSASDYRTRNKLQLYRPLGSLDPEKGLVRKKHHPLKVTPTKGGESNEAGTWGKGPEVVKSEDY